MAFCKSKLSENKYCLQRSDGTSVPMWIHAVNAKARALFKAQNIQSRQVDGEGDDAEDAPMTAVSNLESKFAAAASM